MPILTKIGVCVQGSTSKIWNSPYVKRKYMLEEKTQKAYSIVLGKFTKLLKRKLKQIKDCSEASTKFDVLEIINIIKSVIFKFEDKKFLPLFLHNARINFYTLNQGSVSNADYFGHSNNLVDIACVFKGQLHNQDIVDIVTEGGYPGGSYKILNQYMK